MSRLFRRTDGRRRAPAFRIGAIGAIALTAVTVIGVAATLPAEAAGTGFTLSAQGTGLQLVLFGTKLTGGNSSACVNDTGSASPTVADKNSDGSPSLCDGQAGIYAASEGEGTLLTSSGVHEDQEAAQGPASGTNGSTTSSCAQGGGTPSGTPVLLSLGLSCAYAQAAVDSASPANPSASSMGEVADLTIGLNGILSPLLGASPSSGSSDSCQNSGTIGALLNTVCTALSSLAGSSPGTAGTLFQGINEALQNLYDVVTKNLDPTITIDVGQAKTSITTAGSGTGAATAKAVAQGSTLDIAMLPGVGCAAAPGAANQPSLAQCITAATSGPSPYAAPLIEILVSPAQSTSSYEASNADTPWTSTGSGSLVTVDVNIPGAQQVISVPPNVDQTLLAGTPLQTTIDLGSAQTNHGSTGASSGSQGAVINVLESGTFPGGSSTQGAVSANLGSTTSAASQAGTPAPPTAPSGGSVTPSTPGAAPATAAATSPTAVHTGEWWSGSLPFLVLLGVIGAGLIGWPRIRRVSLVSRVVSRVHR